MYQFYRACLGLYVDHKVFAVDIPPHLGGLSVVDLILNEDCNFAALNNECNAKGDNNFKNKPEKSGGFWDLTLGQHTI